MMLKINILNCSGSLPVADLVITKFNPQHVQVTIRARSGNPSIRVPLEYSSARTFHEGGEIQP